MDNTELLFVTPKTNLYAPYKPGKQQSGLVKVKIKVDLSIGENIIAKLIPFKFAILTGLQRKGIDTRGMKFKTVVATYYNEYSGKKINVSDFINNVAFKVNVSDETLNDVSSIRNQTGFVEVSLIVDSIINMFKESRKKFETALIYGYEPEKILSDEDISRAKAAKIVEENLLKKFKADHFMKVSEMNLTIKWLTWLVVVLYLCYIWD